MCSIVGTAFISDSQGVRFDDNDPMFNPPIPKRTHRSDRRGGARQLVPSAEEDMRRLFEECEVARGNARLLNENLAFAKPSDLAVNSVIKVGCGTASTAS